MPKVYPAHPAAFHRFSGADIESLSEVRYVSANGGIRWSKSWVNVSITCAGEYVGLEEIDDGVWNVYFGPLKLGRLLERHMRIEGAFGRLKRHNV
jgi:putative transposase